MSLLSLPLSPSLSFLYISFYISLFLSLPLFSTSFSLPVCLYLSTFLSFRLSLPLSSLICLSPTLSSSYPHYLSRSDWSLPRKPSHPLISVIVMIASSSHWREQTLFLRVNQLQLNKIWASYQASCLFYNCSLFPLCFKRPKVKRVRLKIIKSSVA